MVCSADHYFMKPDGYHFDGSELGKAHDQCLRNYLFAITSDKPHTVIVDNTNTRTEDIVRYAGLALALGHDLEIVTFMCHPELGAKRNSHGVPLAGCERAADALASRVLPANLRKYEHVIQVTG